MTIGQRLNVLISGAGIAGPSLAFWLHRLGHTCTIVERASQLRAAGQQIDIRRQGIEVVKRMNILDEIKARGAPENGVDFIDPQGKSLQWSPAGAEGNELQSYTSEIEIMRGDLCRILYEKTKKKARFVFGQHVESFQDVGDGVEVRFSNGEAAKYDLLVGADGQGSKTRSRMFGGKDQRSVRTTNCFIAYCDIPRTSEDPDHATVCFDTKGRILATRWQRPDVGQAYFLTWRHGKTIKPTLKQNITAQKTAFQEAFSDSMWNQRDRLLGALRASRDFYAQECIQVNVDKYFEGRVVLLGDAAYCPSPLTGHGTTMALMGGYILAGEIAKHNDLHAALKAYDDTLRPHINITMTKIRACLQKTNKLIKLEDKGELLNLMNGALQSNELAKWPMPQNDALLAKKED